MSPPTPAPAPSLPWWRLPDVRAVAARDAALLLGTMLAGWDILSVALFIWWEALLYAGALLLALEWTFVVAFGTGFLEGKTWREKLIVLGKGLANFALVGAFVGGATVMVYIFGAACVDIALQDAGLRTAARPEGVAALLALWREAPLLAAGMAWIAATYAWRLAASHRAERKADPSGVPTGWWFGLWLTWTLLPAGDNAGDRILKTFVLLFVFAAAISMQHMSGGDQLWGGTAGAVGALTIKSALEITIAINAARTVRRKAAEDAVKAAHAARLFRS